MASIDPHSRLKLVAFNSFWLSDIKDLYHASVTSNHGPQTIFSTRTISCRKAEWSAHRNFTPVLFLWSHQATGPIRLDMAVHLWFDRIVHRIPHGPSAMPVWASYGPRMGISNVFHILREPYGACAGTARVPYGTITDTWGNWHNQNLQKKRTGVICDRTGPVYAPYMGCLWSLNPYGACKLMMHAFKLFGPCTGRQNSYGAAPVTGCTIFVQNSPGTARTGPGSVMWLGHQFKSGNNSLPYGAKPLSEPMMTYPQWGLHTRLNEISSAGKWSA